MIPNLKDLLILHEGLSLKPYIDTVGKITIGVGRNLTDNGISRDEAEMLLDNDILKHNKDLIDAIPWVLDLDRDRLIVLQDMVFNLGIDKLLGFKNTLELIRTGQYDKAADAMLQSKWAKQVGLRAVFLAKAMREGT